MSLTLYFAGGSCSLPALVGLEEARANFDAVRLVLAELTSWNMVARIASRRSPRAAPARR